MEEKIMRNLVLKGSFDHDFIQRAVEEINLTYVGQNGAVMQPNVTIFMTSGGGYSEVQKIFTEMINHEPHRFKIVAVGEISSAAFKFFFDVNCDKTVLPQTIGMHHIPRQEIDIGFNNKPHYNYDKFITSNFPKFIKEELLWCEGIGMTAAEIEKTNDGEDVYFTTERLRELINIQKDENRRKMEESMARKTKNAGRNIGHGESKCDCGLAGGKECNGTGSAGQVCRDS